MSGERKSRSKLWRVVRRLVFFMLIVAVLAGGIFWAKNLVLSRQVQFVTSQAGTLESSIEVDALVANTEQAITTSTTGKLDKILVQGDRVRRGSPVARIIAQNNGGKVELTAPGSGLVNYNIDGQEGIVTFKNLQEWDLDKFQEINPTQVAAETFQSGQAVFKITDNLLPTYLFFKLPKAGLSLAQGDSLVLQIEQQKVNGKVVRLSKQGPRGGVVIALNSFLSQSLGKRRLKLNWIDNNPPNGQIIPAISVIDRQGTKGVYIIKDGVAYWQPVKIKAQAGDKVCVDGLKNLTTVITTPEYVHDNEIING